MSFIQIENLEDPNSQIIDPVLISHKFGIYSNLLDDPFFGPSVDKRPIFCGGIVQDFNRNVYNIKKGQIVSYISMEFKPRTTLSSNLLFHVSDDDIKCMATLPYASSAMAILRLIAPQINEKILLMGTTITSILLAQLLGISGAKVTIHCQENSSTERPQIPQGIKKVNIKELSANTPNQKFSKILFFSRNEKDFDTLKDLIASNQEATVYIYREMEKHFRDLDVLFNFLPLSDVGFTDLNYQRGIKYPYSYVRWDYKRNLDYFLHLSAQKEISFDFFDLIELGPVDFRDIKRELDSLIREGLYLLSIEQAKHH